MGKSTDRRAWFRDRETGERWVGKIGQHSRPQTPPPAPPPTKPLQEEEKTSSKTPTNLIVSPAPTRTQSPIYELSAHDAVPKLAPPDPNSRISNLDWNDLSKCQSDKNTDGAEHYPPYKTRQTPKVQPPSDMPSSDTHDNKPRAQVHWDDQDGLIPVEPITGDGNSQNGERPGGPPGGMGHRKGRPTHHYHKEDKGDDHHSSQATSNSQRQPDSDNHEGRQSRQRHHNAQQSRSLEDSRGRRSARSGGSRTNVDSHDDRPGRRGTRGDGGSRNERGHPHHDRQSYSNIHTGAADLHSQSNRPAPRSSSNYRSPYAESVTDSSCE